MDKAGDTAILLEEKRIKKELNNLKKIFKTALKETSEDGKTVITDKGIMLEKLLEEAAFVRVVLLEAKRLMQKDGIESETINGSQKYKKETPATKIYAEYMHKAYIPLINTLITYIPEKKDKKQARLQALMMSG